MNSSTLVQFWRHYDVLRHNCVIYHSTFARFTGLLFLAPDKGRGPAMLRQLVAALIAADHIPTA